jgi:phage-related protein
VAEEKLVAIIGADIDEFTRAMKKVSKEVSKVGEEVSRELEETERSVGKSTKGISDHLKSIGKGIGISSITASTSSLIPVMATAGAGAMALGSAFASAGAGAVAFGAVAVGVLGDVFTATEELAKAQEALDNADTPEERARALEKQAEALAGLSEEQKKAVKSLQDFKSFWGDFTKGFEKPVVGIFTDSLGVLKTLLNEMKPAIKASASAIQGLVDSLGASLKTEDMQRFFKFLGDTAGANITAFGKIFGNTFRGIANLMVAFKPLSKLVMDGLVGMTDRFAEWSSALVGSDGMKQFINYVKTNAPVVMSIIGDIASTVWDLLVVFAPLGQTVLGVFDKITGALSTFAEEFKSAFQVGNIEGAGQAIGNLVSSIIGTLASSIPQLIGAGMEIVSGLVTGISQNIPQIVSAILGLIQAVLNNILTNYPLLIQAGVKLLQGLVQGLVQAIPNLLTMVSQIITMFSNMFVTYMPMILQAGIKLIIGVVQGIIQSLPMLIQSILTLVQSVLTTVVKNLPLIIQAGIKILNSLVDGIIKMLPQLMTMALELITTVFNVLIQNLPTIIDAGMKLLNSLIDGIVDMLPALIKTAVKLIIEIFGALIAELPTIIEAGIEIILALIDGLIDAIPDLVGAIPDIIDAIFDAFAETDWLEIGEDIIKGIAEGLGNMKDWLFGKMEDIASGVIESAKDFLGIHSPSRVFRDEVGKWIPAGVAVGIESKAHVATDAVEDMGEELTLTGKASRPRLRDTINPLPQISNDNGNESNIVTNKFEIASLVVREEADIRKIAEELQRIQQQRNRAGGVVAY